MGKVIGIDLGTGNSCVAVIENGTPSVVANSEGSRTTPSIVSIENGERKIGGAAKRQMITKPKNTISFVKRYMGANWNDADVQKMNKMVTYEVVEENGKPRIVIDGKKYSAEEISSFILQSMKKTAEEYYGEEVTDAVITCPAWFNDAQRQATKLAGELAGLNVLRIINEPTAAILASKFDVTKGDKKVLVADLGCGTMDASLCELSSVDGQLMVEVLASFGDVFLGGQNYDNAIVEYLCDGFMKEHANVDLRKDPIAYSRIVEAAEKAKCELSSSSSTEINLPYITAIDNVPQMLVTTLTRATFEQITKKYTDKVVECAVQCVKNAEKSLSDVDTILLVGGSTRIPAVRQALADKFNINVDSLDKSVNPDESVAIGAAIQANIIAGGGTNDLLLLDVTPISLGIETMGGVMTKLIDANTTIPCSKKETFSTAADNQTAVTIHVLQGERPMAADNKSVGMFNLDGIAPARRGVPQIEVTFDIDANGILKVSAMDKATKKEQHITIDNQSSLTQEEIDRIKADAEKYKEEDAKRQQEINELNMCESYTYQVENTLNDENFANAFTEDDKNSIKEVIDKIKAALPNRKADEIKPLVDELHKVYDPIIQKFYAASAGQDGAAGGSNPFDAFMQGDNSAGPSAATGGSNATAQ